MVASEGHSSERFLDLLSQYMKYKVNGPCPDDWSLGQRPIMQGCEPFPRRRCFSKSIPKILDIHGVLNAVSWGILFPVGVIIARYIALSRQYIQHGFIFMCSARFQLMMLELLVGEQVLSLGVNLRGSSTMVTEILELHSLFSQQFRH
ncbi:uncharacterized protein LOC141719992 [Apium graveolens]|uniref:uncharacterized protein LOC141719992 n=1 Tax=Apium graveolens TaxID=4045 RepID=UPI003D7B568B